MPRFRADVCAAADGTLAVSLIRFNGWGRKQPHSNDAKVAERVAARLGLPVIDSGLVGEQGGVEHDGAGTLLAHASCWDNPNRNRLQRAEIEARLLRALGGKKLIWAPGIRAKTSPTTTSMRWRGLSGRAKC